MFGLSASALNHLLEQSGWALQRLAQHAGKTARFHIAPFSFAYTVQADGTLHSADAATSADVVCRIAPSLLPRLASGDESARGQIDAQGDPALLSEIFYLSQNLRWDATEDLSRVTGDIAAERLIQAVHSKQQHLRDGALNLSQSLAEYWTEERPLLAKPAQIAGFVQAVDTLRDDVARLEWRVKKMEK